MAQVKTIAEWLKELGLSIEVFVEKSAMDKRVVDAIIHGRYTASPEQRQRLSAALGMDPEQIHWGHLTPVEHFYGH